MSNKAPAFPWFKVQLLDVANDLTDVKTLEGEGAYFRMLRHLWMNGPQTKEDLEKRCKQAFNEIEHVFNECSTGVQHLFSIRWLEAQREKAEHGLANWRKAGEASAAARLGKSGKRNKRSTHVEHSISISSNGNSVKEHAGASFETAFEAYGRHGGKMASEKAWGKLNEADRSICLKAIPDYVKGTHTDGTFPSRKHFSTYLNQRCWEDAVTLFVGAPAKPMTKADAHAALNEIRKANNIPDGGVVGPELMTPEIRALIFQ